MIGGFSEKKKGAGQMCGDFIKEITLKNMKGLVLWSWLRLKDIKLYRLYQFNVISFFTGSQRIHGKTNRVFALTLL